MDSEPSKRDSVWSQFHSPVLENATAVELENAGERARQVEIRKVRQSIAEMSLLLAEMQQMYQTSPSQDSQDEDSQDEYLTAVDAASPVPKTKVPRRPASKSAVAPQEVPLAEGPQRLTKVRSNPNRESLRASIVHDNQQAFPAPSLPSQYQPLHYQTAQHPTQHPVPHQQSTQYQSSTAPTPSHAHSRAHSRAHSQTEQGQQPSPPLQNQEPAPAFPQDVPQGRKHRHPKGHAFSHAQKTCRHPRSQPTKSSPAPAKSDKTEFSKRGVEKQLGSGQLSIENMDLPTGERKLLERFISALSKLSVEVQMDEAKRKEGRRRMQIALRALEGWI